MQRVPATIGNSGHDGALQSQQQPHGNGGGGGDDGGSISGGFTEDGDRNSSGNRWPKQETLALIKIRSEMDATFRDSNLKGPLWDEVSRKLSELGFNRSAKKCREKFENVYKYHRRTKEGRTSKSDKTYRFSDQLQALDTNTRGAFPLAAAKPPPVLVAVSNNNTVPSPFSVTRSDQNNVSPISVAAPAVMAVPPQPVMNHKRLRTFPFSQPDFSGSTDSDTSSDTFSSEEMPPKKRKWEDFFGKLMKEVIGKQEELQKKFLETIEKQERDRVAREEAWRAQEIAKMNQEHDRLVKERSVAAAKDAAVISFLQKMTGKNPDLASSVDGAREKLADFLAPPPAQQQIQQPTPPPAQQPPPLPPPQREVPPVGVPPPAKNLNIGGGGENILSPSPSPSPSSSRWPKAEINALITIRTQLDIKYQENTPKGPLWEEIAAAMVKLGYNRNAKRCKEKWENINKYYKKMKESNKKRSDDSKTCPYFDQLDAIYSSKAIGTGMDPIVARPEQQWPPAVQENVEKDGKSLGFNVESGHQMGSAVAWPEQKWRVQATMQEPRQQPPSTAADMEDQGSDDYDDDGDDEEDEDGGYEIVPSKISSMAEV